MSSGHGNSRQEPPPSDPDHNNRRRGRGARPDTGSKRHRVNENEVGTAAVSGQSSSVHRRGARRDPSGRVRKDPMEKLDCVASKPASCTGKKGTSGSAVQLRANFFPIVTRVSWSLHNYAVSFDPPEDRTSVKKALVMEHSSQFGNYLFDGSSLYLVAPLRHQTLVLPSFMTDGSKVLITLRHVGTVQRGDAHYVQLYNIIIRSCLELLGLKQVGRHFYDMFASVSLATSGLELLPGYITSMRNYEHSILLNMELSTKVIRTESCLNIIRKAYYNPVQAKAELVGRIVVTTYNQKTYRIDDIDFGQNPLSEFEQNGAMVSLKDYYSARYERTITDDQQPLLVSRPKARDLHRGDKGDILLIPELCQMTGLSDEQRSRFETMKRLAQYTQQVPDVRVGNLVGFMGRLRNARNITEIMHSWGLQFGGSAADQYGLVRLSGRVLPNMDIMAKTASSHGAVQSIPTMNGDWSQNLRAVNSGYNTCIRMHTSAKLVNWVLILTRQEARNLEKLVTGLMTVGDGIGFQVSSPKTVEIRDGKVPTFVAAVRAAIEEHRRKAALDMIFCVLPGSNRTDNQVRDLYSNIKKVCYLQHGVQSQCMLSKHLSGSPSVFRSVLMNVLIQMNAKLGGVPWAVRNYFKDSQTMVVGIDIHHPGKIGGGKSVVAMVSTTNNEMTSHYSTVSFQARGQMISNNICESFTECCLAYAKNNELRKLPDRIFIYRDGVGEGQLTYLVNTELDQIKDVINGLYTGVKPKLTFIVVTKRGNTRIFKSSPGGRYENPLPGTVVDDIITLPERYDFYLVTQYSRLGTASPTSYNVIWDDSGMTADQIQVWTYRLCHLYYNWAGTVAVPAVCQYAHRLSYLTGISLGTERKCDKDLRNKLFFL